MKCKYLQDYVKYLNLINKDKIVNGFRDKLNQD